MRLQLEQKRDPISELDEDLQSDALFIANQLERREGIKKQHALQIAIALVKRKSSDPDN